MRRGAARRARTLYRALLAGDAAAAQGALAPLTPARAEGWGALWRAPGAAPGAHPAAYGQARRRALCLAGVWAAFAAPLQAASGRVREALEALVDAALSRVLALAEGAAGSRGAAWRLSGATVLARGVAGAPAVARALARAPEALSAVASGARAHPNVRAEVVAALGARALDPTVTDDALAQALRAEVRGHWGRITCQLVGRRGGGLARMHELSELAGAAAEMACRRVAVDAPGLAIVAQGKLGARELNVASDIDLQLVDEGGGEASERAARRLLALLGEHPQHGTCYRVDLDLRPEGKSGALVHSVDGAEHYYEAFGQTWERLALLRARHLAGSSETTSRLLARVRPFVAPKSPSAALVAEVRALRDRVACEQQAGRWRRRDLSEIDLKRDAGGIREVELFVQTYQVLHGGHRPALVAPGLVTSLAALAEAALLPKTACRHLRRAYLRLRRVENFLQAREGRQTHRLPTCPAARASLSAWLGLAEADQVVGHVAAAQARVRKLTRRLFGPAPRLGRRARAAAALLAAPGPRQRRLLRRWGFADPEEARQQLAALARAPASPMAARPMGGRAGLGPALLLDMRAAPDPAMALRLWGRLEPVLSRQPAYLGLLNDAPVLRRRLTRLLGTSAHLGRILVACPELIDELARPGAGGDPARDMAPGPDAGGDAEGDEAAMERACRAKVACQLHIGAQDVISPMPVAHLGRALSAAADACIAAAWARARAAGDKTCGPALTVLALGRLGAHEMLFGSDLDLVFVAHGAGPPPLGAVRQAQRFIRLLTTTTRLGAAYPIDLRLRPSGAQGPLVVSSAGLVAYYRGAAALWEAQAMLRARPVAGDVTRGARLLEAIAKLPPPGGLGPAAIAAATLAMRERLAVAKGGGRDDIRFGPGGTQDVEFFAQGRLLAHAWRRPELVARHTLVVLDRLASGGLIARRRARLLAASWEGLIRVEHALRMVEDRPTTRLPRDPAAWRALARRLGAQDVPSLRARVTRTMARVRRLIRPTRAGSDG